MCMMFFVPFLVFLFCLGLMSFHLEQSQQAIASHAVTEKTTFDVGYTPGNALKLVLKGIHEAREHILVAAYLFTSKPIATALLEAHKRGVAVAVIADHKSNGPTSPYSAATFLANQGVQVRLNGNYAIFHHKFMVIDDSHIETGSFNYSSNAAKRNAENVLLVWNAPELAAHYSTEWKRLWNESQELKARY